MKFVKVKELVEEQGELLQYSKEENDRLEAEILATLGLSGPTGTYQKKKGKNK